MAAYRNEQTLQELTAQYQVHLNQISQWKKHVQQHVAELFTAKGSKVEEYTEREKVLYEEIGRLQCEVKWLKKRCIVRQRSETFFDRATECSYEHSSSV